MASGNAVVAYPSSIAVAGTVETATLGGDFPSVEVVQRGTAGEIWFCVDGQFGPNNDGVPGVIAKDCYFIPAGGSLIVPSPKAGATVVRLISSTVGAGYVVQGVAG